MGILGLGGMPGAPTPPDPFGGGGPFGQPFSWPQGVPNPFGLPSPGQIGSTIGGWFSNPYGTTGTQGNQNPWGGINPFGNQLSGPAWDPGRPNPWGSQQGDTSLGQSGGFAPLNQMQQRPKNPLDRSDTTAPHAFPAGPGFQVHETGNQPQFPIGGHWSGGVGVGGPGGQQWEAQKANGSWYVPQKGQAGYKDPYGSRY